MITKDLSSFDYAYLSANKAPLHKKTNVSHNFFGFLANEKKLEITERVEIEKELEVCEVWNEQGNFLFDTKVKFSWR